MSKETQKAESPDGFDDLYEELAKKINTKDIPIFARKSEGLGLDGEVVANIIDDYSGKAHSNKIKLFKEWKKLNPKASLEALRSIVENFNLCKEEDIEGNAATEEDGERAVVTVNLSKGVIHTATFGPQVHTKNNIEHATFNLHSHYHTENTDIESASTSVAATTSQESKQRGEGFTQISKDIFMSQKVLRKGSKIYKGYQQHVSGDRLPVAIKMIVPCEDKNIREVKHLVKLAFHPNVVQIIKSKVRKGSPLVLYIVMELCSTRNLRDYLNEKRKQNAALNFDQTMSHSKQLVSGLRHIHGSKIIHRDFKPENILLSNNCLTIKVCDFGISKGLRPGFNVTNQSSTGQGTQGFRSPEAHKDGQISRKADIFCFGLTMFALWSNGKHPFGDDCLLRDSNITKNKGRNFSGLLISGQKEKELIDLLEKCLQFDQYRRPTIEQISHHPFFSNEPATPSSPQGPAVHHTSFGQARPIVPKDAKRDAPVSKMETPDTQEEHTQRKSVFELKQNYESKVKNQGGKTGSPSGGSDRSRRTSGYTRPKPQRIAHAVEQVFFAIVWITRNLLLLVWGYPNLMLIILCLIFAMLTSWFE